MGAHGNGPRNGSGLAGCALQSCNPIFILVRFSFLLLWLCISMPVVAENARTDSLLPIYKVTFAASAGGMITGSAVQTVGYGKSTLPVTATASTGYRFTNWTGAGFTTTTANPLTVTSVSKTLAITANFVRTYKITFTTGAGGSLAGTATQTILAGGTSTPIKATPAAGYRFVNWTGTGFTPSTTNPLTISPITQALTLKANFIRTYQVTFVPGSGGFLTGTTTQTVDAGGVSTTITATPATGYVFSNWTVNGAVTSTANPLVLNNVTQTLTVKANFTQQILTVTFVTGVGGSVGGATVQTVPYGGSVGTLNAVPAPGYTFTNWTGIGFTTSTANPLVINNITQNLTVTANFTQQTFTVTFAAGSGGSLSGTTTQTVPYGGSTSAVSAVPATGYTFTNWTGNGVATSPANSFVITSVTQNLTVTANFTQQTFTVTFAAGSGGSLSGTTTQTIPYGGSTSALNAVPATGYTFTKWTGSGVATSSANPFVISNVTQNLTVTANFTQQTFTVTFVAGSGGSLSGTTTQTVPYGGSTSAVSAVPATGYTFANWTGSGVATSSANPFMISNVTQNLTVTANFTQQTFTVTFVAGSGGSLSGTTTQTVSYGGSTSAVNADPATGYTLTNWTGSGVATSSANPFVISNVTQNLTVTANFTQQTFTVTFVAGSGGSLSGIATQTVPYGGSTSAVNAVPATGYTFTNWTGSGIATSSANPFVIANVTQNLTVTANFTQQTFTVTFVTGSGGSLSGTATQTVPYGGSTSPVSAVPNGGYALVNWAGAGFGPSSSNPLTIANVTSDLVITASFASSFPVNFNMIPYAGGGTLTGNTSQIVPNGGSTGAVTAVPAAGWGFVNWTGTGGFITTTSNPLVVANVNQTSTITANFTRQPAIGSFTASPMTINAGQTCSLSWGSVNYFTSASIDHGVGTIISPNGLLTSSPSTTTTYTLTATNAAGTTTQSVTITVITKPVISGFSATPSSVTAGNSSSLGWSVSGATSLSINQCVGVVSGSSVNVSPGSTTVYTLTATNSAGSTTATATLTVLPAPPAGLTYPASPVVATKGSTIALAPVSTGGPITSYSVAPALPAGLVLNTSTGAISGTPTTLSSAAIYTVTGSNISGSTTAALTLTVNDASPSFGYGSGSYTFTLDMPITPLTPVNSGGTALGWSISPALPPGLSFNTANGCISGTPSAPSIAQSYTVSASNSGGSYSISPILSVFAPGPVITAQPSGQIQNTGTIATFTVAASGTGMLTYQWARNGAAIPGATSASYTTPVIAPADDGAVFSVIVNDDNGTPTTSGGAVLSVFQDLATWLGNHPKVAGAIKWQFQCANLYNSYAAPAETDKITWANWSSSQQNDLNQAYIDACTWFSQGAPQVSMIPGGANPTDQPLNLHPSVNSDSTSTMQWVTPAYMWKLYISHVAFSLMLEISHQLPWSIANDSGDSLRYLLDSSTMAWYLPNGNFWMGTYAGANLPALRANTLPRTTFADPKWTYPWLKQAGIIGGNRLSTIGNALDWMRHNLYHFYGAETFGTDAAIWQYRGYSPVSKIVNGTVDSRYPDLGAQHWTAGCHGSVGFIDAILRPLNIPVQPIWVCGHELAYFVSEDLYMDHGDDPYNANVRNSSAPILGVLMSSGLYQTLFTQDLTINILDLSNPAGANVGYMATHF